MSDVEVVEVEEVGQELAVRDAAPPATLFRTDDPAEVVARATATANALMAAVNAHDRGKPAAQKLVSDIQGRKYPKVECWTLLGTMLGVFPVCVWTRKTENGWEARVEAHTLAGAVVGAAEAECLRSESSWKNRDDYAIRSMAQTRATSKALRVPLGFVVTLAGLEATPAEEIPDGAVTRTSVPSPDGPPPPAGPAVQYATNPQKQKIALAKDEIIAAGGMTEEQYRSVLSKEYGDVTSAKDLTKAQASQLIERLEAKRKEMGL